MKRIFGKNLITIFMGGAKLDPLTRKFYLDNNINICEGYVVVQKHHLWFQ